MLVEVTYLGTKPTTIQEAIEFLSTKIGLVLLVLGAMFRNCEVGQTRGRCGCSGVVQGEARRTLKMAAAAGRGSSILRAVWAFVVLGALLVTLPLLAIWSLFALGLAAAGIGEWTVASLLALLWSAAGIAGFVGLILARTRGPLDARAIRIRQALLLAGIAAAAPLSVGSIVAGLADPQPDSIIALAFAAPFTVLILQGIRDISSLRALLAGPSEPMRLSAAFLWLALICVVGAAAGHLAL